MIEASQRGVAFAKTTRPWIGSALPRAALFARLDGEPGRKVAWIAGPPGAGKTTLAASYLQARGWPCVWYQFDPDDSDPATFFHYLRHGARKLNAIAHGDLPAFALHPGDDIAPFARRFFRQLFALAPPPVALVLDRLHTVPPESALHGALAAGFDQIPRGSCVVVTCCEEPPAVLARMRATGTLVCVTGDDLRIRHEELMAIAELRGQALSPESAAKLEQRTQGWAAGLVLMLEHAKLSGRMADLPDARAPQALFDFLAGEIFDRFEPRTREFLLRIACLPRMTAASAHAISGDADAARLLVNLALNDYFVREVPYEGRRVYQLHPLLREFLKSRATQVLPDALGQSALRRAAAVLREAGQAEDSVTLALESADWDDVARLAADEAETMLAQGRGETLASWLEQLPAAQVDADPRLLHALGAARIHASPRTALRCFERAYAGFQAGNDARGMLRSALGIVDAIVLEFDDATRLDHWLPILAGLSEPTAAGAGPSADATAALLRGFSMRDPGNADLTRWLDRAAQAEREPPQGSRQHDDLALARATALALRGDLAAVDLALEKLQRRSASLSPAQRAALTLALAVQSLLAGAPVDALASLDAALARARDDGAHGCEGWLHVVATIAALAAGQRERAQAAFRAFEARGEQLRRGDRALAHYLRGWLAAVERDHVAALRETRTATALAAETGAPWLECLARTAAAEMLAATGDRRGAQAQLRSAHAIAQRMESPLLSFGAQLAEAAAAHQGRDECATREALAEAFGTALMYGLQDAPVWRNEPLAELCVVALRESIQPDFVRALVRRRRLAPVVAPLRIPLWPWQFRIETLGGLRMQHDDSPIEFAGKGPGRPIELLKVLVALGGRNVRTAAIADALWPQADADFAHKSFTTALHRLRRTLGHDEAVLLRDGRLSLNAEIVWVDTWAFMQTLDDGDALLRAADGAAVESGLRTVTEEALRLYRGPFLFDEADHPAYVACREQIRARLLRWLGRAAKHWGDAGRGDAVIDCLQRFTEADPLYEPSYRQLMACHQRLGEDPEAIATYERLRTLLATRLGTLPSADAQGLYAALLARSGIAPPAPG